MRSADQILVLDKGEQVALGRHEELLVSSAIYQEIQNSQHSQGGGQAWKYKTSPSSLRRLTRDLLQARLLFLLASLGTVAQVALTVLLPVLIGNAVDSVLLLKRINI